MRQRLALIIGVSCGFLLGKLLGMDVYPYFSVTKSELWLIRILSICALGLTTGAITSLISWKHTPGLPGMACALAVAMLGLNSSWQPGAQDYQTSFTVESLLILLGFLLTYMAAWAADTQIVFRSLPVKPPPKQIGSRILLTKLLPCAIVTAIGGLSLLLPVPKLLISPLCFIATGFLAAQLFQSRSTLWYSAAVPCCFAALGLLALTNPQLIKLAPAVDWRQNASFALCGLSAAGAIFGYWLWLKKHQRENHKV